MRQLRTLFAFLPLSLAACGGELAEEVAPARAPTPVSSSLETLENAPETAEALGYTYNVIGKRDPFRTLFGSEEDGPEEALGPLQRFEIDQLKLVAIVSGRATPYAMVEDPEGIGHTLNRGKLIGKNWGRVSRITPDCVVISEAYRDYTGRLVVNEIEMCIPTPSLPVSLD